MFKDKKANKIIISVLIAIYISISLILALGQKSSPEVIEYEISGLKGNTAPTRTQVILSFNRVMNRDSVEKNFSIQPQVSGNFAWSGKKMIFTPKTSLNYGTEYKVFLSYAKDSEGNAMNSFNTKFSTKPNALYYLSGNAREINYLKRYDLATTTSATVIDKKIQTYSIAPDNLHIAYSIQDGSQSKVFVRDLENNKDSEILLPNNIIKENYEGFDIGKLVFDKYYIGILAQPININNEGFNGGRLILLYDLSTTEIKLFDPKDKINDSDTIIFTPDHENVLYKNSSENYAYSPIKGGEPTIIGKYPSANGFNYKQDKLLVTDFSITNLGTQSVDYLDDKRQLQPVSITSGLSLDPQFANLSDTIVYAQSMDTFKDLDVFGLVKYDLATDKSQIIYFDKDYSSDIPIWSPDDTFLAFERYDQDSLLDLYNNLNSDEGPRIVFNSLKPHYGEICYINLNNNKILIAEKGREIRWEK